ncbi:glucose PTS transporter subunit IIA [Lactiplantibacillus plantarum]|uniref:glucose PTS transporter subunit IIA n=1 Tax=Lactiplantibacillus plantarum TaxID=1590 RepID=UPI001EE7E598|nr:glucose PTS transporter subunit IIA [Lactiplantibacillus plantarum]
MKQVHLLTPVAGQLVPLESVHDPVFSQGMMGQGFGIEPTDGQVVAPISGKVTMVAASLHAIGFTGNNGLEVLVHLGIDTVELADRPPFKVNVKVGDTVEAGEKVAVMDLAAITSANKDTTVIMAVTNTADMVTKLTPELGEVRAGVVGAVVELKEHVAEASVVKGKGGKYDELATQIIAQVGGPVNVKSVIHCITRVRFYLERVWIL